MTSLPRFSFLPERRRLLRAQQSDRPRKRRKHATTANTLIPAAAINTLLIKLQLICAAINTLLIKRQLICAAMNTSANLC